MRGLVRLVPALLLTLGATQASAQREIKFAPYAVPSSGTIALSVRQNVPQEGAFAEVDAAVGGALRRAVTSMNHRGERDKVLDLGGVGPYERVILIGTGNEPATPRALEDVGGWVGQVAARSPVERVEILWPGAEPNAGAHLATSSAPGSRMAHRGRTPISPAWPGANPTPCPPRLPALLPSASGCSIGTCG